MNIIVITQDYPDKERAVFPFVKNLVDQWAEIGHNINVIAPFSVTHNKTLKRYDELPHPDGVTINRPYLLSLSNIQIRGKVLTELVFNYCINRALNKLDQKPDVIYCHFWIQAIAAYEYAKKHNIPIVVASGESVIPTRLGGASYQIKCNYVSGVICVSSKNLEESLSLGLTTRDKCVVYPNGVNKDLFKKSDESVLRNKLSIHEGDFVIAFVGWFIDRKGANRVSKAIEIINDPGIKSIFIGEGQEEPACDNIIFKGRLPHDEIPHYLNCADVFILPTRAEGCCNAIIEAMACGLPVISSNLPFNWDVLNNDNSIMISPNNIDEIAASIVELKNNKVRREAMANSALKTVEELSIGRRADKIIKFIEQVIE